MPLFNSSLITSAAADSTPVDPVTRSLRFDTNGKLSRTFGTPNSKKKFTLAFWVKRAGFSSSSYKEIWQYNRGGRGGGMGFAPTQSNWMDEEEFQLSSRNANTGVADVNIALTTRFRDPAAWMHIALVVDTTLGSSEAADRIKIFVNNERHTNYDTSHTHSYYWPAQNYEFSEIFGGTGAPQNIGLRDTNNHPLNGYLADIYFIDGAAIEPNTNFIESTGFGSYKPKAFDMSGYSGNSFHIDAQPANDSDLLVSSIDRNDGDTTFADAAAGHTLTKSGDPEHSIAVGNPFTGDGRAAYFDGSSDYLTSTDAKDDANFDNSDWTLEFWINPSNTFGSAIEHFMGCGGGYSGWNSTTGHSWVIFAYNSTNEIYFQWWNGSSHVNMAASDDLLPKDTWTHVAVVNQSGTKRFYIGGVQVDTDNNTKAATSSPTTFNVGVSAVTANKFNGYLYDVSIQRSYCKYEDGTTFTPPTSKITADSSNTEFLLQPEKDDSSFEDESSNGHTISATGAPTRTASTPYDAAAKSTAMYFDGNDYLETASTSDLRFGTGDFTVECWFNPSQVASTWEPLLASENYPSDASWVLYQKANGIFFRCDDNGTNLDIEEAGLLTADTWYHVAAVRSSGDVTVYLDGSPIDSTKDYSSYDFDNDNGVAIGYSYSSVSPFNGYIFDVRITKGTAQYTSDFSGSLPSAPFELNTVYIGGDQSGNKNHFEPTNISGHDVMLDTPTKNYAVLNVLDAKGSAGSDTFREGNLDVEFSNVRSHAGTVAATGSGKYYAEVYYKSGGGSNRIGVGVVSLEDRLKDNTGYSVGTSSNNEGGAIAVFGYAGQVFNNLGSTPTNANYLAQNAPSYAAIAVGDIVQIALDLDAGTVKFGLNGDWYNNTSTSAFASAQTVSLDTTKIWTWLVGGQDSGSTERAILNAGQDPTFGGNKTSGQDTSQGEFFYAPPNDSSGNPFKSLNTSNLADPSVTPSEHFAAATYEGNNGDEEINLGFTPGLTWIKRREDDNDYWHGLYDSVRGLSAGALASNSTNTEDSTQRVASFDSDTGSEGFTLASGVFSYTNTSGKDFISWNWKAYPPSETGASDIRTEYTVKLEDPSDDGWGDGSWYDSETGLPTIYMEVFEKRSSGYVALTNGKIAVQSYDSSSEEYDDKGEQTFTLKCSDLDAIEVRWNYDTSADGEESAAPTDYNGYLNEQKITILNGTSSTSGTWVDSSSGSDTTGLSGTNNYNNDDGSSYEYTAPTGWDNENALKTATSTYSGSFLATITRDNTSVTPVERFNRAAGFTIIKYTGDSSDFGYTQTLDHSLNVPLDFVIAKARTNHQSTAGGNWVVWHKDLGDYEFLVLNSDASKKTDYYNYEIIEPAVDGTQHQITVNNGYDGSINYYLNLGSSSGSTPEQYILYGWAGVEGYSKFGKYDGNSDNDGPFIYTGFRPAFVMVKRINAAGAWAIFDNKRDTHNVADHPIYANSSDDEAGFTGPDFLSNGIKWRSSTFNNTTSSEYIYAIFAEQPFAAPANAR